MGNEYSSHSSDVHDDQEIFAAKIERIIEVQPARRALPDVPQRTSKTSLGEDEVESQTTKLKSTLEMQLVGEALPDLAQGTCKGSFRKDSLGQIDKQQHEADALSLPNEAKETQVLQVNYQKGETSPSVSESGVDVMKEAGLASEVNTAHCCMGDTTEVVTVDHPANLTSLENNQYTEQVYELNVGGQPLEHNFQGLSTAQQKPDASRESCTINKKIVSSLRNKADLLNTNLSKSDPAVLTVNDLEAQHPWELAAVPAPQATAKSLPEVTEQLQYCGAEKPSSIKELAKAVPNEQALEIAETQVADLDEEKTIRKTTQTMHTEWETTPVVTQQVNAEMEVTAQDQNLNGSIPDLLQYDENLMNAPKEEGKLQVSLVPEKKKLFCCTVL